MLKSASPSKGAPSREGAGAESRAVRGRTAATGALELQRKYGNRYVARLAVNRQAEASTESESSDVAPELEAAIDRARGGGQPMSPRVQTKMESAFGVDFGAVRMHTDGESHALNSALGAVAFTSGRDIFFSNGAYEPEASAGRELLAHELTHVVQQNGPSAVSQPSTSVHRTCAACDEEMKPAIQPKLALSQPFDAEELEADATAKAVSRFLDGEPAGASQDSAESS